MFDVRYNQECFRLGRTFLNSFALGNEGTTRSETEGWNRKACTRVIKTNFGCIHIESMSLVDHKMQNLFEVSRLWRILQKKNFSPSLRDALQIQGGTSKQMFIRLFLSFLQFIVKSLLFSVHYTRLHHEWNNGSFRMNFSVSKEGFNENCITHLKLSEISFSN